MEVDLIPENDMRNIFDFEWLFSHNKNIDIEFLQYLFDNYNHLFNDRNIEIIVCYSEIYDRMDLLDFIQSNIEEPNFSFGAVGELAISNCLKKNYFEKAKIISDISPNLKKILNGGEGT